MSSSVIANVSKSVMNSIKNINCRCMSSVCGKKMDCNPLQQQNQQSKFLIDQDTNKMSSFISKIRDYVIDNGYMDEQRQMSQVHAAIIFKGSKILSYGVNSGRECYSNCHIPAIHAEHAAIDNYLNQTSARHSLSYFGANRWCFKKNTSRYLPGS